MFYLIQFHWAWLLLTVLLGIAIGWATCTPQTDDRYRNWISTAAVAFLVGLILALLRLLPGRLGYFLDMALLMFSFYIIGCCIGCWSKGRLDPDPAAVTPTPAKAGSGLATDQRQAAARVSAGAGAAGVIPAPIPGLKPATLSAPINAVKDDLKLIRGVGPTNEDALNRLGIFHFSQIAQWKPEEITWVSHWLAFPGRIERERWVDQAQVLNRGQDTVFAKQVKSGAVKPDDALLADSAVASLRADLAIVPEAPTGVAPSASAPVPAIETGPVAPSLQPTASAVPQTSPTVPSGATAPASASQNEAAAASARPQTDPIKPERIDAPDPQTAGAEHPASKPVGQPAPTGGTKDDLKLIKGIGPNNEMALNDLGIFHFRQIADWTADEAAWSGHQMAFPGRVEREHWIDQAKLLSAGIDTEHARAVREGVIAPDDMPLSVEEANQLKSGLPKQIEAVASEDKHDGRRPLGLTEPRSGQADDLKRIKGIGPQNEGRLHALGIWHFDQIAAWSTDNVHWVGSYLAFPGRIDREQWVGQAKVLASGADISKGVQRDGAKPKQ